MTDENEIPPEKSKTQFKREASDLQKLGVQLTELSEDTLNQLDLPEQLLDAVLEAKKIHQRGGRKRQLQYIGKIMRKIDAGPIEQSLLKIKQQHKQVVSRFHQIESWRDELVQGSTDTLSKLIELFPELDRQYVRQLMRNAQRESSQQKTPKSARLLFKYLQELDNLNAD